LYWDFWLIYDLNRLEKRRQAMLEMPQMVQTWKEVSDLICYCDGCGANITYREVTVVDGRSGRRNRGLDNRLCIIVGVICINIIRGVERLHTMGVGNIYNCTSSLPDCLASGNPHSHNWSKIYM
jgi:hypothetical protein